MTTFANVRHLSGGFGDDRFTLVAPGTLSGQVAGGSGDDTLVAADVATTFEITGLGSGTMTGLAGGFTGIENLTGGDQTDSFTLNGGTVTGTLDGAGGVDTVVADNVFNVFQVTGTDRGELTGTGGFVNIENLVGNGQQDNFVLNGGTVSGTLDGQGGFDSLFADNLPGNFVVNGPNSGTATGTAGFAGIEQLWGGAEVDEFVITEAGVLDGFVFGADGDDRFLITPGLGLTFNVFGGFGNDQLLVDAQAGVPTDDLISIVSIAPGGAAINYFGIESRTLDCDTCAAPAVPRSGAGRGRASGILTQIADASRSAAGPSGGCRRVCRHARTEDRLPGDVPTSGGP